MLSEYRDTIYHCLKCGACRLAYGVFAPICPSGMKYGFDSHYAIGRISIARAVMDGEINLDADLMRRIYTCTSCGACDVQCHDAVGVDPLRVIEELKFEAIEKGSVPPEVRDFLKHMNIHGNPYLLPAGDRGKWAEGMGIEMYSGQENLFYVGDAGSYDERAQKIARSIAKIFMTSGLSFGILGEKEMSDGNEVNRVGERGLYEHMAKANIERFREMDVRKIITLSPHAYHAFKNDYPRFGAAFVVKHYSQVLSSLVKEEKLIPTATDRHKATFHDPCFLGRHNNEYEAPREVLRSIAGLELVEMERNRENALCCGGGGGNFFTDILGAGPLSPARFRVREAMETGAEILVTACPKCFNMLDDAVKAEDMEGKILVRDLSQFFG
jgi:Fe-S oxidoreductase